jgi:hypothetical protein
VTINTKPRLTSADRLVFRREQNSALSKLHAELAGLVARVRWEVAVDSLSHSQLLGCGRVRHRPRTAGSSRHLADVIATRRGPAGVVSHVRIAAALAGKPAHLLDPLLVLAIVGACHQLCETPFTSIERAYWLGRVGQARIDAGPLAERPRTRVRDDNERRDP